MMNHTVPPVTSECLGFQGLRVDPSQTSPIAFRVRMYPGSESKNYSNRVRMGMPTLAVISDLQDPLKASVRAIASLRARIHVQVNA